MEGGVVQSTVLGSSFRLKTAAARALACSSLRNCAQITNSSCLVVHRPSSSLSMAAAAPLHSSYVSQSSRLIATEVLGVHLPRLSSGGRVQRWRALSQAVGESDSPGRVRKIKETKVVIMVDPVEAKRLAAAEMRAIEAQSKLKRQREIEAINGGWAVLGLTAGVVIDGYSGKSILIQIAGYIDALADFITRITPS